MKVFITGGSGWIGSAVVPMLIAAGHSVLGLARSDASADKLTSMGTEVVRGGLEDLDIIKSSSISSDAVIHCGFVHDFADFMKCVLIDKSVVESIASVLEGTNKPFIISSGALSLTTAPARISTELDGPDWDTVLKKGPFGIRAQTEAYVLGLKARGIRSMAIRLPPSVHGKGDHGFVPMIIEHARKSGVAGYLGSGDNVWPTTHVLDVATVYVEALEKGEPGTAWHPIAEEGVKMKDIMTAIGKGLGVEVKGDVTPESLGWMVVFLGMDAPTSSAITRKTMNWSPTQKGLLEDLGESYF